MKRWNSKTQSRNRNCLLQRSQLRAPRFLSGDTLIEVMFAIGIFGMVSISAISLMNHGLNLSENALEVTMARQEMDAQAEALRFLHDAYASTSDSDDSETAANYGKLWQEIINQAYTVSELNAEKPNFFTSYNGSDHSCADLYEDLPRKSFVINPRLLGSNVLGDILSYSDGMDQVLIKNTTYGSKLTQSVTYPRLVYGLTADDGTDKPLSDITSNALYHDNQFYSAEGIWVTAVASEDGVDCRDEGGDFRTDFYDFYIRTCWDAPGGNTSDTVSTTIRLYNSDQSSLTVDPVETYYDQMALYFVMTWTGANGDIDAHLKGDNDRLGGGSSFEVFYADPVAGEQKTYEFISSGQSVYTFQLDVDAIDYTTGRNYCSSSDSWCGNGNGDGYVEVIAFRSLFPGTFNYRVIDYRKMGLENNNLTVRVFAGFADEGIGQWPRESAPIATLYYPGGVPAGGAWEALTIEITDDGRFTLDGGQTYSNFEVPRGGLINKQTVCGTTYHPTYMVEFDANGGEGVMGAKVYNVGEAAQLPGNQFTNPGFAFSNWNLAPDNTDSSFADHAYIRDLAPEGETVTLYAQWGESSYRIIYDANGGSGMMDAQRVQQSQAVELSPNAFAREDYTFVSWNTEPDGSGTHYSDRATVTDIAGTSESITLYAQWSESKGCGSVPIMQDWDEVSSLGMHETTELCDSRDGNVYPVIKLKDGRVWLQKNLRLDFDNLIEDMTAENTNHPTYEFLDTVNRYRRGLDDGKLYFYAGNIGNYEPFLYDPTHTYDDAGVYYSWRTAKAGISEYYYVGQYQINDVRDVNGDICPSGWRLPTAVEFDNMFRLEVVGGAYPHHAWNQHSVGLWNAETNSYMVSNGWIEHAMNWFTLSNMQKIPMNYFPNYQYIFTMPAGMSGSESVAIGTPPITNTYVKPENYRTMITAQHLSTMCSALIIADSCGTTQSGSSGWDIPESGTMAQPENAIITGTPIRCVQNSTKETSTYEIRFQENVGLSEQRNLQQARSGEKTRLLKNTWTRYGYVFTGWNSERDGSGVHFDDEQEVLNLTIGGWAYTLYAEWEPNSYKVIFDPNGGTPNVVQTQTVTRDEVTSLRRNSYTRDGYLFVGWGLERNALTNGMESVYSLFKDVATIINAANRGETMTLYAQWIPLSDVSRSCNLSRPDAEIMQNWNGAGRLSVGQMALLCDQRDGTTYSVIKVEGGSVWMTQNLRLDFSSLLEPISAANTNHPTDSFVNWARGTGATSAVKQVVSNTLQRNVSSMTYITANLGNQTVDNYGIKYDEYGVYYSWPVAVAGNNLALEYANYYDLTARGVSPNTNGDICPRGWHIPTATEATSILSQQVGVIEGMTGYTDSSVSLYNWRMLFETPNQWSRMRFVYGGYYMLWTNNTYWWHRSGPLPDADVAAYWLSSTPVKLNFSWGENRADHGAQSITIQFPGQYYSSKFLTSANTPVYQALPVRCMLNQ